MIFISTCLSAQTQQVRVVNDAMGSKLTVNGEELMINGMNWDY
jgi:hypothetical protein